MHNVNFLAVIGATLAAGFSGVLWYSPLLFAKAWMRECGFDETAFRGRNPALLFGSAFLLNFVTALVFAICMGPGAGLVLGFKAGLVVGVFWAGSSVALNYLFEGKSLKLFAITGGYHVLRFTLIGIILGIWN